MVRNSGLYHIVRTYSVSIAIAVATQAVAVPKATQAVVAYTATLL